MTEKQEKFLAEYLKDFNGAAAARRMGYADSSAKTVASRLLRSPGIREALAWELTKPSPSRVIAELQAVAFAEGSDENGSGTKLASKLRALELLGKHLGLFEGSGAAPVTPVTIIEDLPPKQ